MTTEEALVRREPETSATAIDLSTESKVARFLASLFRASAGAGNPAAAILPWICDRLPSEHSRRAYAGDLRAFVLAMETQAITPLDVTGDAVRVYKAALLEAGHSDATVSRVLSVIRGTYQQFGKKGLVEWERVRDIQSVESPRVDKNTTLLATSLTSTLQKEILEGQAAGYVVVGMVSRAEHMVIMEKASDLR